MIGTQLEQYRIDARQGRGVLGTVFRAFDTGLIRPVALKIIDPRFAADATLQAHVMQQARAAAKLIHPSIATIYNFANGASYLYVVSEFVAGHSLSHLLAQLHIQQKALRISEILYLVADIADALAYAHQQGVLHRNLKPTNIFLKATEGDVHHHLTVPVRVIVTDFGMTYHLSGDVKSNPYQIGDGLHYMSPEQCIGSRIDGRSDIYVLGLILYELLAGRRPFTIHTPVDAMLKHTLESPPSLSDYAPDVPKAVADLVSQAIAKQPQKRIADMRHFADSLRHTAATVQDAPHRQRIEELLAQQFQLDASSAYTKPQRTLGQPTGTLPVREEELAFILQEALVDESDSLMEWDETESDAANTPPMPHLIHSNAGLRDAPPPSDKIIIQRPGYDPSSAPLDKERVVIGRSKNCDITLDAPDVSRQHARLQKTRSGWQVVDLSSTGGTYWGGHKLLPDVPEPWNATQQLRIGPYSLRWQPAPASKPITLPQDGVEEAVTRLHAVPLDGVQTGSPKGQFSLMVNPILLTVSPGEQAIMQVELFNRSAVADTFKVQLLDLPSVVSAMSQGSVFLAPGERATLPMTIALEDDRAPAAGHYPFQVMVRRESDPTDTAVVAARLTVGEAEKFSLRVWPLEVPQNGTCQVLIRNEGNTNGRFSLTAHSANPSITFLGERGQVRLEPGRAATLSLTIGASKRPIFGRRQHHPFAVKVRAESGSEKVENGRLSVGPHLPAWVLPAAEITLVLLFVIFAVSSYFANSRDDTLSVLALPQAGATDAALSEPFAEIAPLAESEGEIEETEPAANDTAASGDQPPDSDEDGLSDEDEFNIYGTDPTSFDSDGDGLSDGDEVLFYETDPTFTDTDLDGVEDGEEVALGTDPRRFDNAPRGTGGNEGEGSSAGQFVGDEPATMGAPDAPFDDEAEILFDDEFGDNDVPAEADESLEEDDGNFVPDDPSSGTDDGDDGFDPEPTEDPVAEEPTAVSTASPSPGQTTETLNLLENGTGWVSLNGEVSSNPASPILIGDTDLGDAVRGYYSYDLSNIPEEAQFESATLSFGSSITVKGAPFDELDCLLIEAAEFELPLDKQDFDADSFYIDCIETVPTSFDVLIDVEAAFDFGLEAVQFRLSFSDETDFDTETDHILLSSRPTLTVTYTITP